MFPERDEKLYFRDKHSTGQLIFCILNLKEILGTTANKSYETVTFLGTIASSSHHWLQI